MVVELVTSSPLESVTELVINAEESQTVLQLTSVLLMCFGLIFLGYVSGKIDMISELQSDGLKDFVTYFSLPALIFSSLARCDFSKIDWNFVIAVCAAKLIIFFLVILVTLITTKPSNLGKAGLFGLFVTQSNDFAMGYPLFVSLYRDKNKNFPDYLYVLAPLQLVLINPCSIFMMDFYKVKQQFHSSRALRPLHMIAKVSKRTFFNPIIIMTFAGIAWNFVMGPSIPVILEGLITTLGNAFTPTSLFLLGLNIVQEANTIKGFSKFVVPCTLTGIKLIVFPLLLRTLTQFVVQGTDEHITAISNFGFLYGTIPTAPTAVIFALTYNISSWVMSSGLIISTIISAPLMFVSAVMIQIPDSTIEIFQRDLHQSIQIISLISIPCSIWTIFIFICGRKWTSITHRITLALISFQAILSISSYLTSLTTSPPSTPPKFYHSIPIVAAFATRFITAILGMTLSLIHTRSLTSIHKVQNFLLFGTISAAIILTCLVTFLARYMEPISQDYLFPYGLYQAVVSSGVLAISLVISAISMIVQQRHYALVESYRTMANEADGDGTSIVSARSSNDEAGDHGSNLYPFNEISVNSSIANGINLREEISSDIQSNMFVSTQSETSTLRQRKNCRNSFRCYWNDLRNSSLAFCENSRNLSFYNFVQLDLHSSFLLYLLLSMIVGFVICLTRPISDKVSGVYAELIFLDVFLVHGQAIATFVLFGSDVTPLIDLWRCLTSKYSSTKAIDKLLGSNEETLHFCAQFNTYHREKCANDICFAINHMDREISAFKGRDLVKWLLESGLVKHRKEANIYSLHLFRGALIKHIDECSHFLDTSSLYQFNDVWMPPLSG